ncbi:DNA polymerase IV [Xanthomonas campestris]|uniref:DNA polymerase IV n=1 Tax=Xanthomonas campestris TaxID=339 RepID=UPI00237861BE|nr:DNA polymerase IV [Xanthomonas campestris]WDL18453.1 DNA polymerase IV [Xanthomonas campestris pv. campestris]WDL22536.1 DNA polymerase IV [Xanthomonas campestris pv. campestris]WDL25387.1 DNA polymerase IV [Xanthomonas campestris pv. campestris]WDL30709.1 DNA polymerase IV [Xanthomonas campestris pv. campestris]WDL33564.1 DNA polymerase IV [Xanthomonas campestris pv. campestris]
MRKIVHVDMDAFYASVEQRDDPSLRGKPVVVAWRGARSVVCAASYEARTFGIRSAMPAVRAERLCPDAVFVPPDFARYKAVSRQVREIFHRHTDLVEPLSLDEAYLDVTEAKTGMQLATEIAQLIRTQIREETQLTASAGIAPNKFLAKIASDRRKPDGQFVIAPSRVDAFLLPLPVNRIPGVGKVMDGKLAALGIVTVSDLRLRPLEELQAHFGSFGQSLYRRARGIDERPVEPDQEVQSVSSEDTFSEDLALDALDPHIQRLAEKTWHATRRTERIGRTVVLKLKTSNFRILTRSYTPEQPPASLQGLVDIALGLTRRVELPPETRYRLVGVGLSGFSDPELQAAVQGELFGEVPQQ